MLDSKLIKNSLEKLRLKLNNNIPSIGSWIQLNNSSVGSIIANNNFDWLVLDLEHGEIDEINIPDMTDAIQHYCPLVFARIRFPEATFCSRALDLGANGIIIPKIETLDQIKTLRDSMYYPPYGNRGVGYSKTNLYGVNLIKHFSEQNKPFLVAMIETKKGVENLDRILQCNDLDAILIGPYDLSASYNKPGDIDSPFIKEKICYILDTCKKHSVPVGVHIVEPDKLNLELNINKGFTFIPYSIDTVFLRKASKNPMTENLELE